MSQVPATETFTDLPDTRTLQDRPRTRFTYRAPENPLASSGGLRLFCLFFQPSKLLSERLQDSTQELLSILSSFKRKL